MDAIHNLIEDKDVSFIRDQTVLCVEACDVIKELLPLVQGVDREACSRRSHPVGLRLRKSGTLAAARRRGTRITVQTAVSI